MTLPALAIRPLFPPYAPPEPRPAEAPSLLSPRQEQVARLAVSGMSNREIAKALGIELGTVKRHLDIISQRLDGRGALRLRIARYLLGSAPG